MAVDLITAFHVTPASNLRGITKRGLTPRIGRRARRAGEATAAVYLFPDRNAADDALGGWLGEAFGERTRLALLMVRVPRGRALRGSVDWEITVQDSIPPSQVTVLTERL